MYKRIAIPLDGSELAERALPMAAGIAERFSASLVLIAVLDKPDATSGDALRVLEGAGVWTGVPRAPMPSPEERMSAYLDRVSAGLKVSAPIRTAVRKGDAATEIVAAATSEGAGLIVMTTRGRTGVTRGLLGSVADRIVHSTDLPVLLIRADVPSGVDATMAPFKSEVVPLDGSGRAEAAIPHAQAVAKAFGATIVPLRVVEAPALAYSAEPYAWPANYADELNRALTAEADRYISQATARIKRGGYAVTPIVEQGNPLARIIGVAESKPDSVIVMTTRGHTGVTRWMLGSVADALVHTASVPILLIRTEYLA